MDVRKIVALLRTSFTNFLFRDGLSFAAALSFYTILSVSPVLVLTFWVAQKAGIEDREKILVQITEYAGAQTAEVANSVLQSADAQPSLGNIAGIAGFCLLLLSAGGIFGQLRHSLNRIWNISPPAHFSVLQWLKKRLIAAGMVLLLAVLVPASLIGTSAIAFFTGFLGKAVWVPVLLEAVHTLLAVFLFSLFFAVLFRYLPDRSLEWRKIRLGALITSVFFTGGKVLIGVYLGYSSVSSAYGAAGSLAVFLLWVYYSAAIFLFGAQLTQQLEVSQRQKHHQEGGLCGPTEVGPSESVPPSRSAPAKEKGSYAI
jgi:membrane protein